MSGIKIESANPDARPTFALHDVDDADFRFIRMPRSPGTPSFSLNDVTDFSIFRSQPVPDTELKAVEKQKI